MRYDKLIRRLRQRIFIYEGEMAIKATRILLKALERNKNFITVKGVIYYVVLQNHNEIIGYKADAEFGKRTELFRLPVNEDEHIDVVNKIKRNHRFNPKRTKALFDHYAQIADFVRPNIKLPYFKRITR